MTASRVSQDLPSAAIPGGIDSRCIAESEATRQEIDRIKREEVARRNLQLLAFELNARRI